jgi:uncharacterized protein
MTDRQEVQHLPQGAPPPSPPQSPPPKPVDERTWALLAHLSGLSGVFTSGIGTVVGPLVVWLLGKDKHPFIDRHGKEALNFGITVLIAAFALALVAFFLMLPAMFFMPAVFPLLLLIPLYLGLVVAWFAFVIIGAIKASNGEEYTYPVAIRFVK